MPSGSPRWELRRLLHAQHWQRFGVTAGDAAGPDGSHGLSWSHARAGSEACACEEPQAGVG